SSTILPPPSSPLFPYTTLFRSISGGNFHGQPLAMAADQLAVGLATLAGVSERRIEQMTNPSTSLLPAFLSAEPGLNSGFMLAQVTAAALASENKMLRSEEHTSELQSR